MVKMIWCKFVQRVFKPTNRADVLPCLVCLGVQLFQCLFQHFVLVELKTWNNTEINAALKPISGTGLIKVQ